MHVHSVSSRSGAVAAGLIKRHSGFWTPTMHEDLMRGHLSFFRNTAPLFLGNWLADLLASEVTADSRGLSLADQFLPLRKWLADTISAIGRQPVAEGGDEEDGVSKLRKAIASSGYDLFEAARDAILGGKEQQRTGSRSSGKPGSPEANRSGRTSTPRTDANPSDDEETTGGHDEPATASCPVEEASSEENVIDDVEEAIPFLEGDFSVAHYFHLHRHVFTAIPAPPPTNWETVTLIEYDGPSHKYSNALQERGVDGMVAEVYARLRMVAELERVSRKAEAAWGFLLRTYGSRQLQNKLGVDLAKVVLLCETRKLDFGGGHFGSLWGRERVGLSGHRTVGFLVSMSVTSVVK